MSDLRSDKGSERSDPVNKKLKSARKVESQIA